MRIRYIQAIAATAGLLTMTAACSHVVAGAGAGPASQVKTDASSAPTTQPSASPAPTASPEPVAAASVPAIASSACPTTQQMLGILGQLQTGGPYKLQSAAPDPYGCQGGWAYILYKRVNPPTGDPNYTATADFHYAGGKWGFADASACDAGGPMPEALRQKGACSN